MRGRGSKLGVLKTHDIRSDVAPHAGRGSKLGCDDEHFADECAGALIETLRLFSAVWLATGEAYRSCVLRADRNLPVPPSEQHTHVLHPRPICKRRNAGGCPRYLGERLGRAVRDKSIELEIGIRVAMVLMKTDQGRSLAFMACCVLGSTSAHAHLYHQRVTDSDRICYLGFCFSGKRFEGWPVRLAYATRVLKVTLCGLWWDHKRGYWFR